MELILLRHGQAEDAAAPLGTDFARGLTAKGLQQSREAARILRTSNSLPDLVLTSPLIRARQTAEEFTRGANIPGPVTESWLASGMAPETALRELAAFPDFPRILIVGHEPDFSMLCSHCLGLSIGHFEVKKGSLSCLDLSPPSPRATLRFLIPFKLGKNFA